MSEQLLPPHRFLADGAAAGGWWRTTEDGRVLCELCPRACHLNEGDRGFCFVRENRGGEIVLSTYGRSTGFCIDPIEKKPLNHFYPGTSVLSFGTAGCNLGCRFCQNWDISKSREVERLSARAMPVDIAFTAHQRQCRSVAFTYNDPVIWAEYAMDTARECHQLGIKTVAVTAGYISPAARQPFFEQIDAANVDLKAFTEEFYYSLTASHLQPVLDTIRWLKRETDVWVEITNLIIPDANDSPDELRRLCEWVLQNAGDDTPVHFTAFHPDFRMQDRPRTPPETLVAAYDVAREMGLKYVYTGNVHDVQHQSTYCPKCGGVLIQRDWYQLGKYGMEGNRCRACSATIAGHFDDDGPGDWGPRRLPLQIQSRPQPITEDSALNDSSSPAESSDTEFNAVQRQALHREASRLVSAAVSGQPVGTPDRQLAGTAQWPVEGAFVTLKRGKHLRACCGILGGTMPLLQCLHRSAVQTATADTRLPTISPSELPYLSLDVSVLHGFAPLPTGEHERLSSVEIGRHGLRVEGMGRSGLLLPNVATEQHWSAEQFLAGVCRKAGLAASAWRDPQVTVTTFQTHYFGGPLDPTVLTHTDPLAAYSESEIERLAGHCAMNVWHHLVGSTPSYYLADCPDGDVPGVALQVDVGAICHEQLQISWRPGVALQNTLLAMTKNLAEAIRGSGATVSGPQDLETRLVVFTDPAMHGPLSDVDLAGFDSELRALVVIESGRAVWELEHGGEAKQMLARAGERLGNAPAAQVYSVTAASNRRCAHGGNLPTAQRVSSTRPPAVAGTFYTADADQLNQHVDAMIARSRATAAAPRTVAAAMVPHAGLVYSGQLATDVLSRIEIPESIVILGPKHTRDGVDWAVAPYDRWQIPGHMFAADVELAESIVAAVDGFQLDEAAHRREHAIEVELPLLARLAPQSKIVGIVMGSGDWPRCRQVATQLAEFLRTLPRPPLLLISSDMNHFLDEQETRRRDALAMAAIDQMNPELLLSTCREHQITMCGVLPAVVVMEAVRQQRPNCRAERVGYTTSAATSGDVSRVVGYAGVLID